MIRETIEAIQEKATIALQAFKVEPPMTAVEWADQNFYLDPNNSHIPGRWKTLPFQVAILNAMGNDSIEMVDVMKSARVGYTKLMLANMCYNICHRQRNQGFWQPTDGDRDDFNKEELEPIFQHIPEMVERFPEYNKKSPKNTNRLKKMRGCNLYLRGGTSAKNYRRIGVSIGYIDELDAFDLDIGGEGTASALVWKRTEGAPFRKRIRGCSPTITDQSQIEDAVKEADYRFTFHIPCPKCKHKQPLEFGGRDTEYGFKWTNEDPETTRYQCRKCKSFLTQSQMMKAAKKGAWCDPAVTADEKEDGKWIDNKKAVWTTDGLKFTRNGKLIDTPLHIAFHIWTAYSPFTTWTSIIREWLKAKNDPLKLKTFLNTTLGETFDIKQGEKLKPKHIRDRVENFHINPLPDKICLITAGVDVQPDRFEVQFIGWGPGNESWVLVYDVIRCDTSMRSNWDKKLYPALQREFHTINGISIFAEAVGIDTGFQTQEAYAFCLKYKDEDFLALKGFNGERPIIPIKPSTKWGAAPAGLKGWNVGVDTAKTDIFFRLNQKEHGENYIHFPDEGLPPDYFEQLTVERRLLKINKKTGKRSYVWFCPSNARNEALDTKVYALAAKEYLNVDLFERYEELYSDGGDAWEAFEEALN